MIKHSCVCSDCKKEFFLEDADWCKHQIELGLGSKKCPYCGGCICHGESVSEIQMRFNKNIRTGKFVIAKPNSFGWQYMCKTVKEVEVK